MNRGHKQTDVIVMDFAMAFDKVQHKRLLYKLLYKIAAHSAYGMFHGVSAWLLVWFFPTSVFGVGVSFWLRLFLIFAYLYLFTTFTR